MIYVNSQEPGRQYFFTKKYVILWTCSENNYNFLSNSRERNYLHPAHEEDVQPPQPELPPEESAAGLFEDLPMPKRDIRLLVFLEPHFSQATSGFDPKTSFSKSAPQPLQ